MFDAAVLDADGAATTLTTGTAGVGGNIVTATTVNGPWRKVDGVDEGDWAIAIPAQVAVGNLDITLQYSDDAATVKETQTLPQITPALVVNGDIFFTPLARRRRYYRSVMVTTTGTTVSYLTMMAGLFAGSHRLNRAG